MAQIVIDQVTLDYPIYGADSRSIKRTVLNTLATKANQRGERFSNFEIADRVSSVRALDGISLMLRKGDSLALLGKNGAGKSTLLKLLGGVYHPTRGTITREGEISSLTDVTMGMDIDSTGLEAIRQRLILLGLTHSEVKEKLTEVAEFTELGPYLNLPIRTYSTGMLVRLGFAATTAVRPSILLMDELIGAGDMDFAEKAKLRVDSYVNESDILVLASHNLDLLNRFCNKAIVLDQGRVVFQGKMRESIEFYQDMKAS